MCVAGAASGAVVLAAGWMSFSIWSEDDTLAMDVSSAKETARSLNSSPIAPTREACAAIDANTAAVEEWTADASALVARGDMAVDGGVSPERFKQAMLKEARAMSDLPGSADGKLVKADFGFGYPDFITGGAMPERAGLVEMQRRWEDVKFLVRAMSEAGVSELLEIDVVVPAKTPEPAAARGNGRQRPRPARKPAAEKEKGPASHRYNVKFFDRPVSSIDAWRAIADSLEKSYVDVKMCGELDSLETDVATGRTTIEKTALDSKDAKMEVTAFCDVEGLKIVMRVVDQNARAVEQGFAGGIGTECYFAPGANEPYICFSSTPKEGIGFVFYTAYSSAYAQRVEFDDEKSPYALRQETEFTDGDYALMITLPWRAFYQKLPAAAGTEWRFECLADGCSWGGSQGIHESSSWGHLVFNLKPAEIAAIRRRLVYDTYKTWSRTGHGQLSAFDRWGDSVVGDPEFSAAVLKPLEASLKAETAKVTATMSDDEVNEVYEKGAKVWIGLDHEIDALRQAWLLKKFTER